MHMKVLIAALLASLTACAETGPGVEGPLLVLAQVDGASWAPDNGGITFSYLLPDGYLFVGAIRRDSLGRARDGVGVQLKHFAGPGRYPLTSDPVGDTGLYALYDPVTTGATNFFSAPPNTGELVITEVDTVTHRIAGRFNFEAQEEGGTRHVSVTRGVFRVEYSAGP
jgi:hypothetical protein